MSSANERLVYRFAASLPLRMKYEPPNIRPNTGNAESLSSGLKTVLPGVPRLRAPSPISQKEIMNFLPEMKREPASNSCICQRPACLVKCGSCGHHFNGRVRCKCPVHPTQIFLMDIEMCPKCKASNLYEYSKKKRSL